MKKFLAVALAAVVLFGIASLGNNAHALETVVIKQMTGNVVSADEESVITLKGQKEKGGIYYSGVRIEIADKQGNILTVIKPKTDAGYNPDIMLPDFIGDGTQQIFLSLESGGSGGFGFYYVYGFEDKNLKVMFDYEQFGKENCFEGRFLDGYRAEITDCKKTQVYLLDLSLKPQDYKDMIWDKNGKLLKPVTVDISGVNTAFPYYNSSEGHCQLNVYQRVTGVASAYALGYINSQLTYGQNGFEIFFQTMMIYPDSL
jgi:hypothetical protein